jgi:hypothetical protein
VEKFWSPAFCLVFHSRVQSTTSNLKVSLTQRQCLQFVSRIIFISCHKLLLKDSCPSLSLQPTGKWYIQLPKTNPKAGVCTPAALTSKTPKGSIYVHCDDDSDDGGIRSTVQNEPGVCTLDSFPYAAMTMLTALPNSKAGQWCRERIVSDPLTMAGTLLK